MSWTNVPKPTGANYTYVNPVGKEYYDDPLISYDSATTFYDGVNNSAWIQVAKPSGAGQIRAGMATGLLMPLTYATGTLTNQHWTKVSKPS